MTTPGASINSFDWTALSYTFYYETASGDKVVDEDILSPFYDFSNNGSINTAHLETFPPDFSPDNGWELLSLNIGGPIPGTNRNEYVDLPSFSLYNRYSGQIRVLVYQPTDNSDSFDRIITSASHSQLGNGNFSRFGGNGSAIFSHMNTPSLALDAFFGQGEVARVVNNYVDSGVWSILEFVAAYDPCVCYENSSIYFETYLEDNIAVDLDITGTGTTTPIVQPGVRQSALQRGFSLASNGFGVLGSGLTSFNSVDKYYDQTRRWKSDAAGIFLAGGNPAAQGFALNNPKPTLNILGEVLPGWMNLGGKFVDVLKFFVGSKGAGSPPRITGYSTAFNLELTGSLDNQDQSRGSEIYTPGSAAQFNPNLQQGSAASYRDPLGVFNLIRTPQIRWRSNINSTDIDRSYDWYYSFDGNGLEYTVNTSAGIRPQPKRIMLSLVFEDCPNDPVGMNILTPDQGGDFRTPWVDAGCFEEQVVNFYAGFFNRDIPDGDGGSVFTGGDPINDPDVPAISDFVEMSCVGNWQLQVLAILEPTDGGDDIVYMGSYTVAVAEPERIDGPLTFNGFRTDEDAVNSCEILPPSPATRSEIARFCARDYDPTRINPAGFVNQVRNVSNEKTKGQSSISPPQNQKGKTEMRVFPNPARDVLVVEGDFAKNTHFIIVDVNGRKVRDIMTEAASSEIVIRIEDLQSGTYLLNIISGQSSTMHKLSVVD